MAAIGTAQSSDVRVGRQHADLLDGQRSRAGRPPTRWSRVSSTSCAPVIWTGPGRAPISVPWASATIWRISSAPGGRLRELVDLRLHVVDRHAECRRGRRRRSTGRSPPGWPGPRARRRRGRRSGRCRRRRAAATTRRRRRRGRARRRRTARPPGLDASVRVSRIAARRVRPCRGRRCRRCSGGEFAGAVRGAAAAAPSSTGGSRKRETCQTCGIGWHRGYEGFELGAMAINAVVSPRPARRRSADRGGGDVAGHRRAPAAADPRCRRRSPCRSSSTR